MMPNVPGKKLTAVILYNCVVFLPEINFISRTSNKIDFFFPQQGGILVEFDGLLQKLSA